MENLIDEKTVGGTLAGILGIGAVVWGYLRRKNGDNNGNGNHKVHENTLLLQSIDGTLKEFRHGQKDALEKLEHIDKGVEEMRLDFAELKGRLS